MSGHSRILPDDEAWDPEYVMPAIYRPRSDWNEITNEVAKANLQKKIKRAADEVNATLTLLVVEGEIKKE